MNPSVQDQLDSCVRALEHVILPALPDSASLAREQTMLVMGQVQIIRAQLDATPAFEAEEADDLSAMAQALVKALISNAPADDDMERTQRLQARIEADPDALARERTAAIQEAIDDLLRSYDGDNSPPAKIAQIVCEHGAARAAKDRAWFAAMGFDQGFGG